MNGTITVWKLAQPDGRPARCVVSARTDGWQTVLWTHRTIALWERHPGEHEALARASELRETLEQHGWRPGDASPAAEIPSSEIPGPPSSRSGRERRWTRPTLGLTAGVIAVWVLYGRRRMQHARSRLEACAVLVDPSTSADHDLHLSLA